MADEKGIKYIPFDGKTTSYNMWSKKFLSLCNYKHCGHVLLKLSSIMPAETDNLDPDNIAADIPKEALRKANELAYSMLTLACTDEVTMHIITSAVTALLPSGCARTAWQNLEQLHKPKSTANKYD